MRGQPVVTCGTPEEKPSDFLECNRALYTSAVLFLAIAASLVFLFSTTRLLKQMRMNGGRLPRTNQVQTESITFFKIFPLWFVTFNHCITSFFVLNVFFLSIARISFFYHCVWNAAVFFQAVYLVFLVLISLCSIVPVIDLQDSRWGGQGRLAFSSDRVANGAGYSCMCVTTYRSSFEYLLMVSLHSLLCK